VHVKQDNDFLVLSYILMSLKQTITTTYSEDMYVNSVLEKFAM